MRGRIGAGDRFRAGREVGHDRLLSLRPGHGGPAMTGVCGAGEGRRVTVRGDLCDPDPPAGGGEESTRSGPHEGGRRGEDAPPPEGSPDRRPTPYAERHMIIEEAAVDRAEVRSVGGGTDPAPDRRRPASRPDRVPGDHRHGRRHRRGRRGGRRRSRRSSARSALQPDVVLMDIRMPRMDGLQATRTVLSRTAARVLILTTFDSDEYVYEALRAGASGFLLKDAPAEQLVAAVRCGRGRRRADRSGRDPTTDHDLHPGAAAGSRAGDRRTGAAGRADRPRAGRAAADRGRVCPTARSPPGSWWRRAR